MVFGKMVGMLLVFFVIIVGSLLAIMAYGATDNRADVSDEFEDTYNTSRSIAEANISFLNVFVFLLVGLLVIAAIYFGVKIFT